MKSNSPKVAAVILAAGSGTRMLSDVTKQRMYIRGESVLHRSVRIFSECENINSIVVVCRADEMEWAESELSDILKPCSIISGGKTRAESAKLGFWAIPDDSDFVAIHDGARCLVTRDIIESVVSAAVFSGAATASTPVTDTLKRIDTNSKIVETIPRESIYSASTPQVFSTSLYKKALSMAENIEAFTDDNMLIEALGHEVVCVDTGRENIKITTPDDISYAEYILGKREGMLEYKIGHGYDVHRLVPDRALVLGGVNIPYEKGLLGHSDADVLTHAIMDSLLGAMGLGDIGKHFPDTSGEFKDISSLELLARVASLILENGYTVLNVDATVILQRPKIASYIDSMRENIAKILGIDVGRINIKATTEEGLGFTGSGEGAAAHSVAMLKK